MIAQWFVSACAPRCCPTSTTFSVEQDAQNLPFITPWERTQHEGAMRFPDSRHFIVEAGPGYERAGFVILQGCRMHIASGST